MRKPRKHLNTYWHGRMPNCSCLRFIVYPRRFRCRLMTLAQLLLPHLGHFKYLFVKVWGVTKSVRGEMINQFLQRGQI